LTGRQEKDQPAVKEKFDRMSKKRSIWCEKNDRSGIKKMIDLVSKK